MSIEELLKPRYKVIASYPNSIFKVGDVFTSVSGKIYCDPESVKFSDYPHLFQPLPWWAERSLNEMPEHVKEDGQVFKAHWRIDKGDNTMRMQLDDGPGEWYVVLDVMCHFEPATEADYTAYITQTKK